MEWYCVIYYRLFFEHNQSVYVLAENMTDNITKRMKFWAKQTPAGRLGLMLQGPRKHPTYRLQQVLNENKGKRVTSLHVAKKPIISAVHKALDAISFGGFSKAKKSLGYDDVYHNYLLAGLDDGTFHKFERNHVMEHYKATNDDFAHDLIDIQVPKDRDLYLDQMMDKAAKTEQNKHNPDFWVYKAGNNNCQYFTRDIVKKNGLSPYEMSDELKLEPQDSKTMLDSIPKGLSWIPNTVTDLAASLDRGTSMVADGILKNKRKSALRKKLPKSYKNKSL
jgi:hypothetical protein